MKAADVMVSTVVTVGPECSVQDLAETLLENRISAVPVVSNGGDLVGIVSEGDLIRRTEIDTERRLSRWLALLIAQPLAAEFVKSHACRVADVMTRDVIVATPDTPLQAGTYREQRKAGWDRQHYITPRYRVTPRSRS